MKHLFTMSLENVGAFSMAPWLPPTSDALGLFAEGDSARPPVKSSQFSATTVQKALINNNNIYHLPT